jgi:hypothetical protein
MPFNQFTKINYAPLKERLELAYVDCQYETKRTKPNFDIVRDNLHQVLHSFINDNQAILDMSQNELDEYRQTLRPGYSWDSGKKQYINLKSKVQCQN